ncbi:MAG: hypothetical protein M3P22_01175 [bacterium]|nr:hypothetical protein [bacterium]
MNNQVKIFVSVIVLLILGTIATVIFRSDPAVQGPGKLDQFAICLKDKGAVFYGAFWCPHCQDQKKLFGSSKSLLPYVECSTADGNAQTQICIDKNIKSYPTWEFADGSRPFSGEATLAQLAEKTGCVLPTE